jgi:uncharacterized membrane protein YvbJ
MDIKCESCGKITKENADFCKFCGFRFEKTDLEALKNIRSILRESQKKTERNSKIQTRVSYASLIISVCALFIALGAFLIVALTLESNQKVVGIATVLIIVFMIIWFCRKYALPIDVDEIEN